MKALRHERGGVHVFLILLVGAVLAGVGFAYYRVRSGSEKNTQTSNSVPTTTSQNDEQATKYLKYIDYTLFAPPNSSIEIPWHIGDPHYPDYLIEQDSTHMLIVRPLQEPVAGAQMWATEASLKRLQAQKHGPKLLNFPDECDFSNAFASRSFKERSKQCRAIGVTHNSTVYAQGNDGLILENPSPSVKAFYFYGVIIDGTFIQLEIRSNDALAIGDIDKHVLDWLQDFKEVKEIPKVIFESPPEGVDLNN